MNRENGLPRITVECFLKLVRESIRKPFMDMIVQSQRLTESFPRRSGGNIIIEVPDPHASGCRC